MRNTRILPILLGGILATVATSRGATYSWTPTSAGPFNWNDAANWGGAGFPNAVDDFANVTANIAAGQTINLNTGITVGTLNLSDTTTASNRYTVAPGTAGVLTMQVGTGSAAINFLNTNTTSGHVISAPVVLASSTTVTNNTPINSTLLSNATISGIVSGSGQLAVTGPSTGWLLLSGTNTYNGGTDISGGTGIIFTSDASFGAANTTISISGTGAALLGSVTGAAMGAGRSITIANGATLSLQSASFGGTAVATYSIAGDISGQGGISKVGASSAAILTGNNTYSGGTSITNNALRAGSLTAFSPNSLVTMATGGRLVLNGFNNTVAGLAGTAGVVENANATAATLTINSPGNTSYSSNVQDGTGGGALGVIKSGTGAQAITNGDFTGGLTLNSGTWQLGGVNGLGNGPVIINGGTISSNNTNSRVLVRTTNTLAINADFTLGNATNSGALTLPGASNWGSVARTVTVASAATLSGIATGTGTITKGGTANLLFTADNSATFNGAWNVTQGSLGFANESSIGDADTPITLDGGLIFLNTNGATIAATHTITLGSGGGTINGSTGQTNTYAAKITGAGALSKVSGATIVMSGANDYTGATNINVGTAVAGSSAAFGNTSALTVAGTVQLGGFNITVPSIAGGGIIEDANSSNATLEVSGSADSTFSGVVRDGTGGGLLSLVKSGSSVLTLSGANLYTGPTTVNGGTLLVSGSLSGSSAVTVNGGTLAGDGPVGAVTLNAGGTVAPGANPVILATGNLNFNGGTLALELNGITAGTDYDQLSATGSVAFSANTPLTLSLGFDPVDGVDAFTIVSNDLADSVNTAGGLFSFGGTPLAQGATFTASGQAFSISYTGGDGNDVVLAAIPEPASIAMLLGGLGVLGARRRRR